MLNIYSFPTFNLTKVLFTAEELGQEYQLHLLDATKGEHKTPEHLARHPLGKVPAVEMNGKVFFESNTICRLLAEEHGNKLYGDTPQQRAIVNQWIDLIGYHVGRWMVVYLVEEALKPKFLQAPTNPANIDEAAGYLSEQLPVLETALSQNAFLAGDSITIADTIAFAVCQVQEYTSLDLGGYVAILSWYKNMAARPSVVKALANLPGGRMVPFPA